MPDLTTAERNHLLTLITHEDSTQVWLGWQLVQGFPKAQLSLARELLLAGTFATEKKLRDTIFDGLARNLPKGVFRQWRQGTLILQAISTHGINELLKKHPTLCQDFEAVHPLFEPVLLAHSSWLNRYRLPLLALERIQQCSTSFKISLLINFLSVAPTYSGAWRLLASLYHHSLNDPVRAVFCYKKATEADWPHPFIWRNLSRLYAEVLFQIPEAIVCEQRFLEALADLTMSTTEAERDYPVLCAKFYFDLEQWDLGKQYLEQALAAVPHYDMAALLQARLLMHRGQYQQAERRLPKTIRGIRLLMSCAGERGYIHHKGYQRFQTAVRHYQTALTEHGQAHPVYSKLLICVLVHDLKQPEAALPYYRDWLQLSHFSRDGSALTKAEEAEFLRAVVVLEGLGNLGGDFW